MAAFRWQAIAVAQNMYPTELTIANLQAADVEAARSCWVDHSVFTVVNFGLLYSNPRALTPTFNVIRADRHAFSVKDNKEHNAEKQTQHSEGKSAVVAIHQPDTQQ